MRLCVAVHFDLFHSADEVSDIILTPKVTLDRALLSQLLLVK